MSVSRRRLHSCYGFYVGITLTRHRNRIAAGISLAWNGKVVSVARLLSSWESDTPLATDSSSHEDNTFDWRLGRLNDKSCNTQETSHSCWDHARLRLTAPLKRDDCSSSHDVLFILELTGSWFSFFLVSHLPGEDEP